jgi:hypothetical protein
MTQFVPEKANPNQPREPFSSTLMWMGILLVFCMIVLGIIYCLLTSSSSSSPTTLRDTNKENLKEKNGTDQTRSIAMSVLPVSEFLPTSTLSSPWNEDTKTDTSDQDQNHARPNKRTVREIYQKAYFSAFNHVLTSRVRYDCQRYPIEFPFPHSVEEMENQSAECPPVWENVEMVLSDERSWLRPSITNFLSSANTNNTATTMNVSKRDETGKENVNYPHVMSIWICGVLQSYLYSSNVFDCFLSNFSVIGLSSLTDKQNGEEEDPSSETSFVAIGNVLSRTRKSLGPNTIHDNSVKSGVDVNTDKTLPNYSTKQKTMGQLPPLSTTHDFHSLKKVIMQAIHNENLMVNTVAHWIDTESNSISNYSFRSRISPSRISAGELWRKWNAILAIPIGHLYLLAYNRYMIDKNKHFQRSVSRVDLTYIDLWMVLSIVIECVVKNVQQTIQKHQLGDLSSLDISRLLIFILRCLLRPSHEMNAEGPFVKNAVTATHIQSTLSYYGEPQMVFTSSLSSSSFLSSSSSKAEKKGESISVFDDLVRKRTKTSQNKKENNEINSVSSNNSIQAIAGVSPSNPDYVLPVPYNAKDSTVMSPCFTDGVYGTLGIIQHLWQKDRVNGVSAPKPSQNSFNVPLQCGHMVSTAGTNFLSQNV